MNEFVYSWRKFWQTKLRSFRDYESCPCHDSAAPFVLVNAIKCLTEKCLLQIELITTVKNVVHRYFKQKCTLIEMILE